MKKLLTGCLLTVCGGMTCLPTAVEAHALRASHERQGETILARFAYSDDRATEFASVRVIGADGKEFQNGRTDARGRFAFVPDAPGTWRIIVADGMGHKVDHPVEVAAPGKPDAAAGADKAETSASLPMRAGLGVSLLANLALVACLLRRRKAA